MRRQFDTNVFGLLAMTRAVLPAMRARGSGRIINVSSLVGRTTFPGMGPLRRDQVRGRGAVRRAAPGGGRLRRPGRHHRGGIRGDEPRRVRRGPPGAAPPERDAYASMLAAGEKYLARQIAGGIAPERVAVVIANAAEHPRPRPRYVVPGRARPLIALLASLPERLADRAKQRALTS